MGGLANESVFAIILQTFGELNNPLRMINESSSISDWTRMASPTSPHFFKESTEENINIICDLLKENKYTLFLRKVHKTFPDSVIKEIMNKDFEHKYELLHNQAKKKNKLFSQNNINIYILISILLVGTLFITVSNTKMFMDTKFFS